MTKVIIQNKDRTEEIIEMPKEAWYRILRLVEKYGNKSKQGEKK